jgi:hypothetical protein
MNEALRERAKQYHAAIREAIMSHWDPIGVASIPEAADEYDAYVPAIYKMLIERKSAHDIFGYLWWLETEHMGLSGDRQTTSAFAERLCKIASELGQTPTSGSELQAPRVAEPKSE